MKPMFFNTEMVKAILAGQKTVTRRVVKLKYGNTHLEMRTDKYGTRLIELQNEEPGVTTVLKPDGTMIHKLLAAIEKEPPYHPGDILYVRETWMRETEQGIPTGGYIYRASDNPAPDGNGPLRWRPSIHMPKEAARLFLRVTDVRVERLWDITEEQAKAEGIFLDSPDFIPTYHYDKTKCNIPGEGWSTARECFRRKLWNGTIPKKDLSLYGWDANPWVWVIEFERISKEVAYEME